jgi:hypothetical protein
MLWMCTGKVVWFLGIGTTDCFIYVRIYLTCEISRKKSWKQREVFIDFWQWKLYHGNIQLSAISQLRLTTAEDLYRDIRSCRNNFEQSPWKMSRRTRRKLKSVLAVERSIQTTSNLCSHSAQAELQTWSFRRSKSGERVVETLWSWGREGLWVEEHWT